MNFAVRHIGLSGTAARLRFENIYHGYGQGDVVKDVSLTANPGEVLCLLGPSGSGKSTLLRIAAGLEVPLSGRLLIDDVEVVGPTAFYPPEKRDIGLMFQDFALFPHMTVAENVAFGLTHLSKSARRMAVADAIKRVGLDGYGYKYPHMLSGGEQQRVALARAVAPRPAVLLMDEPFSGLDSRLKDKVRADTLSILRETGATVVIVTHDPEEAMGMADHIALLKEGVLVQCGSARELFQYPSNLFAASFFSEINQFDVLIENGFAATPFGRRRISKSLKNGPVMIAVRYNDVHVGVDARLGAVPAKLQSRQYLGTREHLHLKIEGGNHHVEANVSAGALEDGVHHVFIGVADDAILVFENRL